ncbi:hypothetical protein ACQP1P_27565 [Dactylosporangium sp. CA-052675]|uniref:hypothetical protein n=1 Tax=Dactylosporangium sp. CA-052675 TaxID=3239927 RepID=UPI003D8F3783
MNASRRVLLAVLVSSSLAFTAACGDDKADKSDKGGTPAASANAAAENAKDPRTALTDAFNRLAGGPASYTTSIQTPGNAGSKLTGSTDPSKKSHTAKMTVTSAELQTNAEVIIVGTDVYVKIGRQVPNVDPKKWMHVDGAKTSLAKLGLGNPEDPANVKGFADAIVSAERTGQDAYKGTFDLTKRPLPTLTPEMVKQMGDAAKSVPFEATVKDGYLATLSFKTAAVGRQVPPVTSSTTFSDFGKAVKIAKPAANETQAAPASFLSQFTK